MSSVKIPIESTIRTIIRFMRNQKEIILYYNTPVLVIYYWNRKVKKILLKKSNIIRFSNEVIETYSLSVRLHKLSTFINYWYIIIFLMWFIWQKETNCSRDQQNILIILGIWYLNITIICLSRQFQSNNSHLEDKFNLYYK